jgi:DNA polymerase V
LAKLANAAAKKNPLFDGVADLRDEQTRKWVLDRFAVEDVWGVGRATAAKVNALGIDTAGRLRDMPIKQARSVGGVVLERIVAELRGIPSSAVEVMEPPRKGMAVTRSFGKPVTDFDTLMGAVAQYATRAGEKLRSHGLVAGRLTVFFSYEPVQGQCPAIWRLKDAHPASHD